MPQMAPLNWLTLFTFFIFLFLMFNVTNYYLFNYKSTPLKTKKPKQNPINWKW
uniref:ATP synthase complex subunit 8 n=1 Tax=Machla setosa TaxID=2720694 RepID=A0A8F3FIV4_9CUCU|nr:ATP synthase F0 subunit 8 [Machla setosa]